MCAKSGPDRRRSRKVMIKTSSKAAAAAAQFQLLEIAKNWAFSPKNPPRGGRGTNRGGPHPKFWGGCETVRPKLFFTRNMEFLHFTELLLRRFPTT